MQERIDRVRRAGLAGSALMLAGCGGSAAEAAATGSGGLDDLAFRRDFAAGAPDIAGPPLSATEICSPVVHRGRLFAGMGCWKDDPPSGLPGPAQILVKDRAGGSWRLDHSFGETLLFSTEALASVRFETDVEGRPLSAPATLLLASASYPPEGFPGVVWVRDDADGRWIRSLEAPLASTARVIFGHRDAVTGVDHVFAGMRNGTIYRGAFDPSVPGGLRWNGWPELASEAGTRFTCAAVANGRVYAACAVAAQGPRVAGGLYERIDGHEPRWRVVYQWALPTNGKSPAMRGLTAVPDPEGGGHEVLVAAREAEGIVERIDPTRGFAAQTEFDIGAYFEALWGGLGGGATLAAYNDMPRTTDPADGMPRWLIGLWVNHPDRLTPPHNGSYYLVRDPQARYRHGRVFDPAVPFPAGGELRATRAIAVSPFAGEAGRVFYFGGYDAGGNPPPGRRYHDTAWIYRGTLR